MEAKIEMSLDDIIKSERSKLGGSRRGDNHSNRGGGSKNHTRNKTSSDGKVQSKRGPPRSAADSGRVLKGHNRGGIERASKQGRADVNNVRKLKGVDKNHLLAAAGLAQGNPVGLGSSKLILSNLDFSVSETDINHLFADLGPLKSVQLHYDRNGRSLGTADVVFVRRPDALKAMMQYNGVLLDGRPMNIQLAISGIPLSTRLTHFHRNQASNGPPRGGNQINRRLSGDNHRNRRFSGDSQRNNRDGGNQANRRNGDNRRDNRGGGNQMNRHDGVVMNRSGEANQTNRRGGDNQKSHRGSNHTNRRRRGGSGRRQPREAKTVEELDAELDAYRNSAPS